MRILEMTNLTNYTVTVCVLSRKAHPPKVKGAYEWPDVQIITAAVTCLDDHQAGQMVCRQFVDQLIVQDNLTPEEASDRVFTVAIHQGTLINLLIEGGAMTDAEVEAEEEAGFNEDFGINPDEGG